MHAAADTTNAKRSHRDINIQGIKREGDKQEQISNHQNSPLCVSLYLRGFSWTRQTPYRSPYSSIAQCRRSTEEALRLSVGDLMDKVLR